MTSSSATIHFETNEEAYVQAEYGKTTSLGNFSGLSNVSSTSHTLILNHLATKTSYYYRVQAKDLSGNQGFSAILNFATRKPFLRLVAVSLAMLTVSAIWKLLTSMM